jgi:GAF domain-containing protein
VRIEDVTTDTAYRMTAGDLPVKSYLAVPVVSRSGEVFGGLLFGHEQPAVFSERVERIMAGIAGQTAIAMDNASLIEREQQSAPREACHDGYQLSRVDRFGDLHAETGRD